MSGGEVTGSVGSLKREELSPVVWEAVNSWAVLDWTGIDLIKAIRYDMLQTVYSYLTDGTEEPCAE